MRSALIALVLAVAAMCLSARLDMGNHALVGITMLYAALVFFQLEEMRKQREQQLIVRQEDRQAERAQKPRLSILPFLPRYQSQEQNSCGEVSGFGFYLNVPVMNDGQTVATTCQPFVTRTWRRSEGTGQWVQSPDWFVSLPLVWSLDEINIRTGGRFTETKDLVPQRHYLFDLFNCDFGDPQHLRIRAQLSPVDQPTRLPPGEYCLEVIVYSANAPPAQKWYAVSWRGGYGAKMSQEQFNTRLKISETESAPV